MDPFAYQVVQPASALTDFVERFWMLRNRAEDIEIVVIPDGGVDVLITRAPNEPFRIALIGLETMASQHIFPADTLMFGIHFKLLGVEYLLDMRIAILVNKIQVLPIDFWGISDADLDDFPAFCKKIAEKITALIPPNLDARKKQLFDLIYSSDGSMTVKALSEAVHWSSRQINRYFNQQFGLSLKAFCTILRFRAAFPQIKLGKLFPEQHFSDQPHFIKEVKKLAGVSPKALFKNQNDRFVHFSTLDQD